MPYVKGHYRNGHWVRPHYRRSRKGGTVIPTQRGRNSNRSKTTGSGGGSVTALPPMTHLWDDQSSRKTKRRLSRKKEQDGIQEVAEFCVATIKDGAIEETADKIADRVSLDAWNTLRRKWGPFRCKWMARLAQQILDAKSQVHKTVADVAMLRWRTPLHAPERTFAHELIKSIPLPGDEHFVAAAHSLRLAGVCLCVSEGIPLSKCACFQPLALEYTKEQLKSILVSSGADWIRGPNSKTMVNPSRAGEKHRNEP